MKGDLYIIRNAQGDFLGAFSAEPGTGADRVAGALVAAEEISVVRVHGQTVLVVPSEAVDDAKSFLAHAGYKPA